MSPDILTRPTLVTSDWRLEPASRVKVWLRREQAWWDRELSWDLARTWTDVEPARSRGELPGLVVEDEAGHARGWTFFLRHGDALQVGSLIADTEEATDALVDGILSSREARGASLDVLFTRADAPGLALNLAARGFEVEGYRYLEASTIDVAGDASGIPAWPVVSPLQIVGLLERAYAGSVEVRPFAPHGSRREWEAYVGALLQTEGCGRFLPHASAIFAAAAPRAAVGPSRLGTRLDGAVLVTAIADATAHIAQIAVDPSAQRRGLGRRLVTLAAAAARDLGMERITLLVAERNRRAAALYDALGFRPVTSFLAAVRYPR